MKQNNIQPEDTKHVSLRWRMLVWLFNLFLTIAVIVAGYVAVIYFRMPSLDAILNETRAPAIVFLDKDGQEIRSTNRIMGTPVTVETLPAHVWQAIVAIEDKRFFNHGPIDTRGLMRAVIVNLFRGRLDVGGSSITQQTAKNIFLTRDKKISRKVQEVILSYWLENRFNKNQILDLYMNRVSLVGGMRGIDDEVVEEKKFNKVNKTLKESVETINISGDDMYEKGKAYYYAHTGDTVTLDDESKKYMIIQDKDGGHKIGYTVAEITLTEMSYTDIFI